jgi:hypothetical protein
VSERTIRFATRQDATPEQQKRKDEPKVNDSRKTLPTAAQTATHGRATGRSECAGRSGHLNEPSFAFGATVVTNRPAQRALRADRQAHQAGSARHSPLAMAQAAMPPSPWARLRPHRRRTLEVAAVAYGLAFPHAAQTILIMRRRQVKDRKWPTEN